jgi:putative nucleotidyltransferase with HDIG domain
MRTADEYIGLAGTLPPAPRIISQLLDLLDQGDVHAAQVVELVTVEPALTAKVIRRCNSAASGLAEPVSDLAEAVTHLGFNEIYRMVTAIVGEDLLSPAQTGYGIAAGELWEHSAATAVSARVLAHELHAEENRVFTAALLHDIGKLVLSTALVDEYAAVVRETEEHGVSFLEAEKQILGVDHAEVGGRLLATWNFPENLSGAVRHHHDPAQAGPQGQLAAFVHLGDIMAHVLGYGHGHEAYAVRPRPEAMQSLEITPREIETFLLQAEAALQQARWFHVPG